MWDNGLPKWEVRSEVPNINFRSCAFTSLAVLFSLFHSGIKVNTNEKTYLFIMYTLFKAGITMISDIQFTLAWKSTQKLFLSNVVIQVYIPLLKGREESTGWILDQ